MIWLIFFLILQTKPSFCRLFAWSQLGFPAIPYVEAATMTVAPSHVFSPEYTVHVLTPTCTLGCSDFDIFSHFEV